MPPWMTKLSKVLQWVSFIVGAVMTVIGKNSEVEAATMAASGAFASAGDYASAVAEAGNYQTGGVAAFIVTVAIPAIFQLVGKFVKLDTGWNAGLDSGALHTLKHVTRVGRADDQPHIDALIASGVALETNARIDGKA
jgi:hypothetical protein